MKMKALNEIDLDDAEEIERQILVRRQLLDEMVGTLYKGIINAEICDLRAALQRAQRPVLDRLKDESD